MSVVFHTTEGNITIRLFANECRDAGLNFMRLCQNEFYTNLVFHRVISDFLIQTGDNTKTGIGGRSSIGESIEVTPTNNFDSAGIVAYAEEGSVRSQIFITLHQQNDLNGRYCGFGKVVGGFNVVQTIGRSLTLKDNYPVKPVRITGVEILENPYE